MTNQFIATRELIAVDRTGSEKRIILAVGAPYQVDDVSWACPVAIQGLYAKLRDIHGVDGWQSLQLATGLVESLLQSFIKDGGKLFWPDTRELYDPSVGKAFNRES
jgi:hypothetical protein